MPHKRKTCKAAAKRFRKTASGKIKFQKAGRGHLLSSKSRKRKRHLRSRGVLHKSEIKRITGLLAV
jgi:large subunit ribosomal protein L35